MPRSTRFCGCANAVCDRLSDAVQVLDAFHVVKLGTQVVDEVCRRVQQETLHRRTHKHDRSTRSAGCCGTASEHLSVRQQARLSAGLLAGDPHGEVELAWSCYQQLRAISAGTATLRTQDPRREGLCSLHTCPIPEVARLGRTP